MCGAGSSPEGSAVRVVLELLAAVADGRMEDVLALTDPRIAWHPVTRPGLTSYEGHADMSRFMADLRSAYGQYRIEVDDFVESAGPQVTARLRVIPDEHGEQRTMAAAVVFTLRAGLVMSVESEPL